MTADLLSVQSKTGIPLELLERKQWCTWKLSNGTKVPLNHHGGKFRSNDPDTWANFEQVKKFPRVGFVLSHNDPYVGIDLDGCIDEDEVFRPWATEILEKFCDRAFAQISPSGRGVKLITRGTKGGNARCVFKFPSGADKEQIECYEHSRFWTMTKGCLGEGYNTIGNGQKALDWLINKYLLKDGAKPIEPTPELVLAGRAYVDRVPPVAEGSRNIEAFRLAGHLHALCDGDQRLNESQVFQLLSIWNDRNPDPLGERELRDCARNGRKNGSPPAPKPINGSVRPGAANGKATLTKEQEPKGDGWIRRESNRTENELATRFVDRYCDRLRYVPQWRKWLVWDGRRWQLDPDATHVLRLARKLTKSLWHDFAEAAPTASREELVKLQAFCKASNRSQGAQAIISLARADSRVACDFESLNADPYLLNVRNGTVDLRTGELREHRQDDLITQLANVDFDAGATCPGWDETLRIVFAGNSNLIAYVQQILGYSISGDIGEHILPIAYGSGNNGKSTIWNAILELAGDYGVTADDSLLLGSRQNHPTEKAQLYQKRIVAISEPEQGSQLREARVKELTGDKFITARRMKEDFWQFTRTHKFWLATNHLPEISGTDMGIWRRVKLIPFTVDISQQVTPVANYSTWLVEHEGAGILNWLIAGFRAWQAGGFSEPLAVKDATRAYQGEQDHIGQFIEECCVQTADAMIPATDLFDAYTAWGGRWNATRFRAAIEQRFPKERANDAPYRNRMVYRGVGLMASDFTG